MKIQFLDKTTYKFVLVGIVNTLFGTAVMFCLYNLFHCSYWISSAANYFLGSILSYFLNKYFTFQNKTKGLKPILYFGINIVLCYFLAYSSAKLFMYYFFSSKNAYVMENGALLLGMGLFVVLNYIGQKFFVFKE